MPRTSRSIEAGSVYHVLNRGNGRQRLFHQDGDYESFLKILREGLSRYPVDLFAYCLMPNHWHLLVRPTTDSGLSRWMAWVGVTHVRRRFAHRQDAAGGHLYQGRFKCFPVQDDAHFLTVARYVEGNPLRSGLVSAAEQWLWSSLRKERKDMPLCAWPVSRPRDWRSIVNEMLPPAQINGLRASVARGRPFGSDQWAAETARRAGLGGTMRPIGRPRKPLSALSPKLRRRREKEMRKDQKE